MAPRQESTLSSNNEQYNKRNFFFIFEKYLMKLDFLLRENGISKLERASNKNLSECSFKNYSGLDLRDQTVTKISESRQNISRALTRNDALENKIKSTHSSQKEIGQEFEAVELEQNIKEDTIYGTFYPRMNDKVRTISAMNISYQHSIRRPDCDIEKEVRKSDELSNAVSNEDHSSTKKSTASADMTTSSESLEKKSENAPDDLCELEKSDKLAHIQDIPTLKKDKLKESTQIGIEKISDNVENIIAGKSHESLPRKQPCSIQDKKFNLNKRSDSFTARSNNDIDKSTTQKPSNFLLRIPTNIPQNNSQLPIYYITYSKKNLEEFRNSLEPREMLDMYRLEEYKSQESHSHGVVSDIVQESGIQADKSKVMKDFKTAQNINEKLTILASAVDKKPGSILFFLKTILMNQCRLMDQCQDVIPGVVLLYSKLDEDTRRGCVIFVILLLLLHAKSAGRESLDDSHKHQSSVPNRNSRLKLYKPSESLQPQSENDPNKKFLADLKNEKSGQKTLRILAEALETTPQVIPSCLKEIIIYEHRFTDKNIEVIANTILKCSELKEFGLRGCIITQTLLDALLTRTENAECKIKQITISNTEGIDGIVPSICELFCAFQSEVLCVEDNELNDQNISDLQKHLSVKKPVPHISGLIMSYNKGISDILYKTIGEFLRIHKAKTLKAVDCDVNAKKMKNLSRGLEDAELEHLDVSCNENMEPKTFDVMGGLITNNKLKSLTLSSCRMTKKKFNQLRKANKTKSELFELDVSYNRFMDKKAFKALGKTLKRYKVQKFNMSGCQLDKEKIKAIRKHAQNIQITTIYLRDNYNIGEGIVEIAYIAIAWRIEHLDISECMLSPNQVGCFRNALGQKKLQSLNLSDKGRVGNKLYISEICELLTNIDKELYLRFDQLDNSLMKMLQDALYNLPKGERKIILKDEQIIQQ